MNRVKAGFPLFRFNNYEDLLMATIEKKGTFYTNAFLSEIINLGKSSVGKDKRGGNRSFVVKSVS